ncbi:MAG: putative membrane protein affecting hemolysin expression [Lentisphaeria bacterium]
MQLRLRFLPPITAACLGGLFVLVFAALLILPANSAMSALSLSSYGEALASMSAHQAQDAAFNHDLVRLQVILEDVIENPNTKLATIHDVENNLLVQAGESRFGHEPGQTFSAPIILHDSIAGYVSITVDPSPWSFTSAYALMGAFGFLLACLAVWSLLHIGALEIISSTGGGHLLAGDSLPVGDTLLSTDAASEAMAEREEVDLHNTENQFDSVFSVIHIKNLDVLRQQLNGNNFRTTITRLEQVISDVTALYGGRGFELIDNYYVLTFKASDELGEALFRSACSAYLVLELAGIIDNIPLDLAALVSANKDDVTPEKLPFAGLIVEASAGEDKLFIRRTELVDLGADDGRKVLSSFQQPFQSLLDKQQKQLFQIL